jgi:acetyl-CoA carboxylase biotin carboxyl carrier protein
VKWKNMTIKEIQGIIKDFESSTLMSLELEMDGFKLKLSKNKNNEVVEKEQVREVVTPQITKETHHVVSTKSSYNMIKSPLVGTFYASSTPTGKPF